MEYKLNDNIYLDDINDVISRVERLSGNEILESELIEHIKNPSHYWYFDSKLNVKDSTDIQNIIYLWIDTGYVDRNFNPIFISLLNKCGTFSGKYVGHTSFLSKVAKSFFDQNSHDIENNIKKFINKYNAKSSKGSISHINCSSEVFSLSSDRQKDTIEVSLADNLYKDLLYPTFRTSQGLDRYLKICGSRMWDLVNEKKSQYYIYNKDKTEIIINSGLINKYTEDVFIIYSIHLGIKSFKPVEVVQGKNNMLMHNFTKEQTTQMKSLSPINFFNDNQSRFLEAKYDDFDLNYANLNHVLNERRMRFPENIQALSDAEIVNKINMNLEFGLKILHRDPFFAKASYSGNIKHKGIAWMLPLYLNSVYGTGNPELVMLIVKVGDFYEIKTVLNYDENIEDRAIATNLYKYMW